jgi:hypothetical protein
MIADYTSVTTMAMICNDVADLPRELLDLASFASKPRPMIAIMAAVCLPAACQQQGRIAATR